MKNEILLFENQDVKLEENSVRSFFEHTGGYAVNQKRLEYLEKTIKLL